MSRGNAEVSRSPVQRARKRTSRHRPTVTPHFATETAATPFEKFFFFFRIAFLLSRAIPSPSSSSSPSSSCEYYTPMVQGAASLTSSEAKKTNKKRNPAAVTRCLPRSGGQHADAIEIYLQDQAEVNSPHLRRLKFIRAHKI